jgi:hypothetical protein
MVAVSMYSWEEVASPAFANPQRQAFRTAVAQVAAQGCAKWPESAGRIERAEALVLAGDVALNDDGTATVYSATASGTAYHPSNGACACRDFETAPHQFCKHRLGVALLRRTTSLLDLPTAAPEPEPAPVAPARPAAAATPPLPEGSG